MPPSATPENLAPPRKLGYTLWRMGNAAFILLIFFAPWMTTCANSDIVKDPQPINGFLTIWFLLMVSSPIFFALALGLLPYFATALGLIAFLVYSPLSLFLAFGPRRWLAQPFWRIVTWILLIGCTWSLFFIALMKIVAPDFAALHIGYWLACLGLLSSLGVEFLTLYDQLKPAPIPTPTESTPPP